MMGVSKSKRAKGGRPAIDDRLELYILAESERRGRGDSLHAFTSNRRTIFIDETRRDEFGNLRVLKSETLRRRLTETKRGLGLIHDKYPGLKITRELQPETFESEAILERVLSEWMNA